MTNSGNKKGKTPKRYERPTAKVIVMESSGPLMGSTETFNEREVYDGEWA